MNKKNFLLGVLLIGLFLITGCSKSTDVNSPEPINTVKSGEYDISVYDTDALDYFLHKEDNKVHIVNFWATWCAPCIKELPYFEQVNKEFGDDNVEVTLISLDFEHQLETKFIDFVKKNELQSELLVILPENDEYMIEKVSKNWQGGAIPVTLIYNKNKRYFIEGETTYKELVNKIEEFKL